MSSSANVAIRSDPDLDAAGRLSRASELRGRARVLAPRPAGLGPVLPGGVPRGHVTEWAGPRSAGKTAALRRLVGAVRAVGSGVAYVDGTATLAPAPWAPEAAARPPFWVVRPPDPGETLVAAEELLRSGAFALVIAEGLEDDWPRARVVRLQRLARDRSAALIAVVDRPGRVPLAGLRIEFEVAGPDRRRVRSRAHGLRHEIACVQSLPYRLPEGSGLPDRRA